MAPLQVVVVACVAVIASAREWSLTNVIEPERPNKIYFLDRNKAMVNNVMRQYHVAVVAEVG